MTSSELIQPQKKRGAIPITSHVARDTTIEMTFNPETQECRLLTYRQGEVIEHDSFDIDGRTYMPYSSDNNLLTHRVVLFASEAGAYESEGALVEEVRAFIHKYVDVDSAFEGVAAHYVLMTWRYDLFKEVPYLRVLGNHGQGKSRFLLTVGSLCFKPIFASGASTVSPIFRLLDEVGGTLVIDEADFRASDERAEIVKILNNGHAVGFPVLRSDVTPSKEFRPRAFRIFGPKLIATRHEFEDEALESRCLTASLGGGPLRPGIPITLPDTFESEALALRNKLLMYRFRRFDVRRDGRSEDLSEISPRLAQILLPLLSVACSLDAVAQMMAVATGEHAVSGTQQEAETLVLASVQAVVDRGNMPVTIKSVAEEFRRRSNGTYGNEISPRFVGAILRRLGVMLHKTGGVIAVSLLALPRLEALYVRYGLSEKRDKGDDRDVVVDRQTPSAPSSPLSLLSLDS